MTGTLNTSSTDDVLAVVDNTTNKINVTVNTGAYLDVVSKTVDASSIYQKGYSDGLAKKVNGKITYTYHVHKYGNGTKATQDVVYSATNPGGCYTAYGHVHDRTGRCPTHTVKVKTGEKCKCKIVDGKCVKHKHEKIYRTDTVYDCGSPTNRWRLGCGKNSSTIESAYIVYD